MSKHQDSNIAISSKTMSTIGFKVNMVKTSICNYSWKRKKKTKKLIYKTRESEYKYNGNNNNVLCITYYEVDHN